MSESKVAALRASMRACADDIERVAVVYQMDEEIKRKLLKIARLLRTSAGRHRNVTYTGVGPGPNDRD